MEEQGTRRRALILGGSGGIGRTVALRLAREGYRITIQGGTDKKALEKTISEMQSLGAIADGFPANASDLHNYLAKIEENLPVDVLIVAYGPFVMAPLEEMDLKQWRRMSDHNFLLPGILVSTAIARMKKQRYGRIILFGGTGTEQIRGYRKTAAYSAAKTGLAVLVKSAGRQLAGSNITCNMVCPGVVETKYYTHRELKKRRNQMPGGQLLETEEIADVVSYLCAPERRQINGAIINIDKGYIPL
ncbi:MAG: SDR family oxidoreductase [Spirochaetales bacterium]|nr:SDR family oxidoreductase [Spirochaetales bacterium]MCF7937726.1 SDR family oxidoreductase [Spirochaetales bacterium]